MMLGLAYEEVPDFVRDHDDWVQAMATWGGKRGLSLLRVQATSDGELAHTFFEGADALWIASGPGPRGHNHAVLCQGSNLLHDPHKSRKGLLSITSVMVFVSIAFT